MSRKLLITIAVVVSLLLMGIVVAGAVTTTNGNEGNIIYAAYNPNSGSLRIVTDGNYKSNEVPIEWNREGPQGPPSASVEELRPFILELIQAETAGLLATVDELHAKITQLQARVTALEEELDIGDDLVVYVTYEELYMIPNFIVDYDEEVVEVLIDNETQQVAIRPVGTGVTDIILTELDVLHSFNKAAVIKAVVEDELDITLFPYSPLWLMRFTPDALASLLNLPDIISLTSDNPDVAIAYEIRDPYIDTWYVHHVFAKAAGSATITFTSSEGSQGTIFVSVDETRMFKEVIYNPHVQYDYVD